MPIDNDVPLWWPISTTTEPPRGVIVATVNYNTKEHIAHLLWSLYRFLGDELRSIVVVDNGSTDGSLELLQAMATVDLCELIVNQQNAHHGPALSQAISYIAGSYQPQTGPRPWLWLLDSDCMIAHENAAQHAIRAAHAANASLIGEAYWNRWNAVEQFAGYSLLLDPAHVWRAEVGSIPDGGDPIGDFEKACRANGLSTLSFPFVKEGYLIHVGRSTLAAVHERHETANPLYEWAKEHHEPHFQELPHAQARYAELVAEFNREVPNLHVDALIRSCQG